jgi:glycosyltransferase involved in cell wall biosynthesis
MYLPEIGGIEFVARDICKSLESENHEVICLNNRYKYQMDHCDNVVVKRLPSFELKKNIRFSLSYRRVMRSMCKEHHIRLFHFPSFQPEINYVLESKRSGIDICLYHADIVGKGIVGDIYNKFITMKFLEKMDYIVVTSPNIINSSSLLAGFTEKIKVIPLAVDTKHFYYRKDNYRERILQDIADDDHNTKIILFVGRISRYKGIDVLLNAFGKLANNYKLVVVSKDSLENFDSLIQKNNLQDRIFHYNNVSYEELPLFYSAADLLAMPSTDRGEAFGLVALEAMACGTPVITTELGTGTSYHNINGKTGLVIQPGNIDELSSAIESALKECFDYQTVVNRANDFNMDKFKNSWIQFVNSLSSE